MAISRTPGFPDKMFVKLKYSDIIAMTYGGLGVPAWIQFRGNSIFDPYYTGVGHQPLCHDQWAVFYNRYRVRGCKYFITMANNNTTEHVEVFLQHRPNSSVSSVVETIRESPYTMHKQTLSPETGGKSVGYMRGYHSVAKTRGVTPGRIKFESDYQAVFGNNPPIESFINIGINNPNSSTSVLVYARVDLTYYVEVFDRKQQSQS